MQLHAQRGPARGISHVPIRVGPDIMCDIVSMMRQFASVLLPHPALLLTVTTNFGRIYSSVGRSEVSKYAWPQGPGPAHPGETARDGVTFGPWVAFRVDMEGGVPLRTDSWGWSQSTCPPAGSKLRDRLRTLRPRWHRSGRGAARRMAEVLSPQRREARAAMPSHSANLRVIGRLREGEGLAADEGGRGYCQQSPMHHRAHSHALAGSRAWTWTLGHPSRDISGVKA